MQTPYLPEVKAQYEHYPYPPRNPAEEHTRLVESQGDFLDVVNFYCFGGRENFSKGFRALVAGCGTGDAVVFLSEQLRDTDSEIVALDFSESSLEITRKRCAARALSNVRFVCAPIEEIPSHSLGEFDYISCSGVLHHLADPDAGLRILARTLKESGGMHLMVYGAYGRMPVYLMQSLLKQVVGADISPGERVRLARALIGELPESNPFKREFSRVGNDIIQFGDIGLYDLLLHAQDRAYTVSQIYAWLEQAELKLATFDNFGGGGRIVYDPAHYLRNPELLRAITSKPLLEQQAVAELVAGNMARHSCYVTKRSTAPPSPDDSAAIPYIPAAWAEDDIYTTLSLQIAKERGDSATVGFRDTGLKLNFKPTPHAARIFKHTNGERNLAGIVACVKKEIAQGPDGIVPSDRELASELRALFDGFYRMDWMLLRYPESRRMRSGRFLQERMLNLSAK